MPLKHTPKRLPLIGVLAIGVALVSIRSSSGYSQPDPPAHHPTPVIPVVGVGPAPSHPDGIQPTIETESRHVVRVRKGETLMEILLRMGVPQAEADAAISSLRQVYDPRRLRAGQDVTLVFAPAAKADGGAGAPAAEGTPAVKRAVKGRASDPGELLAVKIAPEAGREIGAERGSSGAFAPARTDTPLETGLARSAGIVTSSLFEAAQAAGLSNKVLAELTRAFSYDVDFQRDLQPGDTFEAVYETVTDRDGRIVDTGRLLFARLVLSGTALALYNYTTRDGESGYFTPKGESVRKALMRTPIDGARLSSGFGKRKHPVLGFTRMHRGVDFAAPKGTPVFAAGSGLVVKAGRSGNYGNLVEIRHDDQFRTAYGHLWRFGKGVRAGTRVTQGQIIGYVGATGLATGPHLHYEVIRNDSKVNPLSVHLPTGRKLRGAELDEFLLAKGRVDTMLAQLPIETKVASR